MKQPLSDKALDQLFREARTYNGYLDTPVSVDQLYAIWDLMKMGPTSANMLPARLIWCHSQEAKDRLAKLSSLGNQEKNSKSSRCGHYRDGSGFSRISSGAFSHMMMQKAGLKATRKPEKSHAMRNSSLQGGYFILAARALGLDTGPMSGFDNEAVDREFFGENPNIKSNFISTLGYGDDSTIFDRSPRPDFTKFNTIF